MEKIKLDINKDNSIFLNAKVKDVVIAINEIFKNCVCCDCKVLSYKCNDTEWAKIKTNLKGTLLLSDFDFESIDVDGLSIDMVDYDDDGYIFYVGLSNYYN